ncbi:hypothetical protein [Sulfitobacter guttiformis]|uniref:Uncharacterized protein n=1 Tax=Sulfitobacter guttiformis TaxID=74349 RepID=A0A420DUA0_9RHOB|nr:hypothetical protein [Sulfitobacter guttiformis]KIN71449.1 hypothetical protein Z949_610 [Sulfitobacter guttiformis KCTC 32187]RKE97891.1 hypothetical protein C8N30_2522 [Sulfitobacter guttiformis]
MMQRRKLLLEILNIKQLVDIRVIEALKRLEQIDGLVQWYEGLNPFPHVKELAEGELKQSLEAAAHHQMTESEFSAFKRQWDQATPLEQRRYLCELAGLSYPSAVMDLED